MYPWIEPALGIVIDPEPQKLQRKSTRVKKHAKVEKKRVNMEKLLIRVCERRVSELQSMILAVKSDFN